MDAYIFQAALLCSSCANERRAKLHPELLALADADNNSDMAPQGPFLNGGGESDKPEYCSDCGEFLENPLTSEGYAYVRELVNDRGSHDSTVKMLCDWYDISSED